MKVTTRIQLMLMMFLMFSTWGAWYGQMGKYLFTTLKASGDQIGSAYATFSIASIVAPFFVGMIADRYFSAQKVMGVLNLIGAGVLYFLIQNQDPDTFFWYILAYTMTFAPNLALSSSIAMNQMQDPGKEFPSIRVLGTIAWIIVTNIIGLYGYGDKVTIFQIAMFTSIIWGLFAFTLPDTPPKATGQASISQILGTDAFVLFKDRSFLIFFISSVLVCIPLAFYYAHANLSLTESHMTNVENKMSLGQASEVLFMLLIPFALQKFGIKKMLIVGLVAWIVRFLCFGNGDGISSEWILYLAIVLHGVCYDFFFVTGQIYTDNKAGDKIKNSAQGLITLATYGVGMGIGSKISGLVLEKYTLQDASGIVTGHNWNGVWMVPAGIAAVVLVLFIIFFNDKKETEL
ncbi:nucleoside transporter [Arcicella aurantiaca]|uniref:Nucleoside transporter n=1 Tax=Arcicella aurantiaca TaxID=591202 RepID=A0A316E2B6_9BACT|nr:nucleoside permease [Arcicella aurantiaca]PWK17010.1 nucleoside transporter [Arcicella aurantiaca]